MYLPPKKAFSIYTVLILTVITLLRTYQPVQAGTALVVEIFADEDSGVMWGKGCSLREAIKSAYLNGSYGGCQANSSTDTIQLQAGEYSLTITGPNEDANLSGDLDIRESITIIGAGSGATKIIAGEGFGDRVFHILGSAGGPTVRITGVEISRGFAINVGGSGVLNQGATLYLDDVLVTGNGNPNRLGGGIYNTSGSVLFATNGSTISSNAGSFGGGIYNAGTASIEGCTIIGNTASFGGGGIYSSGTVTITDSTITDNTASSDAAGLASNPNDPNASFTQITGSIFSLNRITSEVYAAGISSNGRLTIEDSVVENNAGIGLLINSGSNVTVTSSKFLGNTSTKPENGAGIDSNGALIIQSSVVQANTGTGIAVKNSAVTIFKTGIAQNSGIGLRVTGGSNVTVSTSSITGNATASPSSGAGITSAGSLTVNYSTIANNAGPGLLVSGGTAALTNSTIGANNKEVEPGVPDLANSVGIASAGSLALNNSTIADHTGGGLRVDGGTAAVAGTLFARNGAANCATFEAAAFTSQGYNLRDQADEAVPNRCLFTDNVDLVGDPALDNQLKNNGGYTHTYALTDLNSPAVDAIDRTHLACLADDQRRFGRPVNGNTEPDNDCDIGAFELGAEGFSTYLPSVRR